MHTDMAKPVSYKYYINVDGVHPSFDVATKITGVDESYFSWIRQHTGSALTLQGSYLRGDTNHSCGPESGDRLHVLIVSPGWQLC